MQFGISEALLHWARYRSGRPALSTGRKTITYGDLNRAVDAVADIIEGRHLQPRGKTRLALMYGRKVDLVTVIVATLRSGGSPVILNPTLSSQALRINLADTRPARLLTDSQNAPLGSSVRAGIPRRTLDVAKAIGSATKSAAARDLQELSRAAAKPDQEWGVLFSSGTTGVPKGIERDHHSIIIELLGWCLELGLTRSTCFYVGRPIYYTGGLLLTLAVVLNGGHAVINNYRNDNSDEEVWKDYQQTLAIRQLDWAFFVPDQLRTFTRIARADQANIRAAKTILVMGAPITGAEKTAARAVLGSEIVESWGNTESLGTITDPEDLDSAPNSIGRPFLTDELWVVDARGHSLPPGRYGRLAGGEDGGFCRYSGRPAATRRARQGGLIISEDIGYQDESGRFYIVGREQEEIIVGKEVLFLPAVEARLRDLKGVREGCVCVARASNTLAILDVAVTLLGAVSVSRETLRVGVCDLLPPFACLRKLVIVKELPRIGAGKVDRVAVRRLF